MKTDEILLIAALGVGAYLVFGKSRSPAPTTAPTTAGASTGTIGSQLGQVASTGVTDLFGFIFGSGGNGGQTNSTIPAQTTA